MNPFFKALWECVRFILNHIISKQNSTTNPVEGSPSDVYEYTDRQWKDNPNQGYMTTGTGIRPGTKNVIICLDNGHGEETPGKRSPWSACNVPPELPFREYAYCREIVSRLAQALNKDGYPVYIVVPETTDVSLGERGRRINTVVADAKKQGMRAISISIHNNAAGKGDEWKNAYGWSVWTTHGQNKSDILAQCLFDAAKEILTPLGQATRHDTSDGDDDYEDNFAMCRMPICPAVLTENMFQDCAKEVEFLLTEEGKNAIVEIHRRGINRFVEKMNW